MSEDFLAGRDAHARGISRDECPDPEETEAGEAWREGWDGAKANVTDIDQQENE